MNFMKKALPLLIIVLAVAACSEEKQEPTATPQAKTELESTGENITSAAENVKKAAVDKANEIKDSAVEAAVTVKDSVTQAAKNAQSNAVDAAKKAQEDATSAIKAGSDQLKSLGTNPIEQPETIEIAK